MKGQNSAGTQLTAALPRPFEEIGIYDRFCSLGSVIQCILRKSDDFFIAMSVLNAAAFAYGPLLEKFRRKAMAHDILLHDC